MKNAPNWLVGLLVLAVAVFAGGIAPANAAFVAWTAEADQNSAYFGVSVASAGDVNGDGYDDVIVGADYYDNGENNEGRVYVYHGSASGLSPAPAWTVESDQTGAYLGRSVASAGDVNGDGYGDVIVGAPFFDNGQTNEGRALVYYGSASGLASTPAWTAEGDQNGAKFGRSVAGARDVNGDGYGDVIVGAEEYDNGQTDEGRAYVYYGSAAGLSGASAWGLRSNQTGGNMGISVASAGDVDGDGYGEVIMGAHRYDSGETDEGRAFVCGVAPPEIANLHGDSLTFTEDGASQQLDAGADAVVSDADDADYSGGYLLVHGAVNGAASDQLTIDASGGITLAGSEVRYGGTPIGDIDGTLDGVNGSDLKIYFDTSTADDAAVGALIQALRFSNSSQNPATTNRILDITLNDGSLDSDPARVTASVVPVDTIPTISDIAYQATTEDTPIGPVAFTVEDVDTSAAILTVTAVSSYQTLLPDVNIALGGAGANRTITLTPTAN